MFLELLATKQRECGLRDIDFAELLGVPRSTWAAARRGIRPLNNRIVRGAMRAFPDLHGKAIDFLVSDSTNVKDVPKTAPTAPERDLEAASA